MDDRYGIKLSPMIKKILDIYKKIDPLKRYGNSAGYIKTAIYQQVNKYLDELDLLRTNNEEVKKILSQENNKDVLEMLENKIRF